jgi:Zn-dependent M28 family amino/carboxypeptidase
MKNSKPLIRLGILAIVLTIGLFLAWILMIWMPGPSFTGTLPPLTPTQIAQRPLLQQDITMLASTIGPRNADYYDNLTKTTQFLTQSLQTLGYTVTPQNYQAQNKTYTNLIVEIPGTTRPQDIIVVGAHYDSAFDSPAANDNGSGVAALLQLARNYHTTRKPARTLRLVFFANEEPPFNWTAGMGSLVYAKQCKANQDNIVAMFSLETIGYYSDAPKSQKYPTPLDRLYPNTGNFLAFIGNLNSRELVRSAIVTFRRQTQFPSQGASLPNAIPGVGWSDHWSFWQVGYRAIMLTDTATFRYPHYHTTQDTPDKIDYDRLTRVVDGIDRLIAEFTGTPS